MLLLNLGVEASKLVFADLPKMSSAPVIAGLVGSIDSIVLFVDALIVYPFSKSISVDLGIARELAE